MLRKLESAGQALLERFVPKISASAQVGPMACWNQCWQCNRSYAYGCVDQWCSYNAGCCQTSSGCYRCYC